MTLSSTNAAHNNNLHFQLLALLSSKANNHYFYPPGSHAHVARHIQTHGMIKNIPLLCYSSGHSSLLVLSRFMLELVFATSNIHLRATSSTVPCHGCSSLPISSGSFPIRRFPKQGYRLNCKLERLKSPKRFSAPAHITCNTQAVEASFESNVGK